jgi:hypothetical protein
MTIEELRELLRYAGAFGIGGLVFICVAWLLLKSYLPSYFSKKAENLTTREDIAVITHEIESVKAQYAVLIEESKARHLLRMAALDRRLQAHQEAFSLWREVLGAAHSDAIREVVIKCQEWWEHNCLYLEPNVRDAFVAAYSAAHSYQAYVQAGADTNHARETWNVIIKFPNILFEAIQLPPLSNVESKALIPDEGQSWHKES